MLTRQELQELRRELRGTKTLSLYLADHARDEEQRRLARRALLHALHETRDHVRANAPADRTAFDRALARAERLLEVHERDHPETGLVAFVTADGVPFSSMAPWRGPTRVVWGEAPSVAPLIPMLEHPPRVAVAIVDSRTAHLFMLEHGGMVAHGVLHAGPHHAMGGHMGTPPRRGFHPGTRGTTVADTAHRLKEQDRRRLTREVAARLEALVVPDGLILIGGIPVVVNATRASLTDRSLKRTQVLRGLDLHVTVPTLTQRVTAAFRTWQQSLYQTDVHDVGELAYDGGLGVTGWERTLNALRHGAVARVLVTERALTERLDDAERAVQLALDSDAELVCVDGDAATRLDEVAAGVAARLRYCVPSSPASTRPAARPELRDQLRGATVRY
jgi:hypothetical protein